VYVLNNGFQSLRLGSYLLGCGPCLSLSRSLAGSGYSHHDLMEPGREWVQSSHGAWQGASPGAWQGASPGAWQVASPGAWQGASPGAWQGASPRAWQGVGCMEPGREWVRSSPGREWVQSSHGAW
jgi:hypothetical protein